MVGLAYLTLVRLSTLIKAHFHQLVSTSTPIGTNAIDIAGANAGLIRLRHSHDLALLARAVGVAFSSL